MFCTKWIKVLFLSIKITLLEIVCSYFLIKTQKSSSEKNETIIKGTFLQKKKILKNILS